MAIGVSALIGPRPAMAGQDDKMRRPVKGDVEPALPHTLGPQEVCRQLRELLGVESLTPGAYSMRESPLNTPPGVPLRRRPLPIRSRLREAYE